MIGSASALLLPASSQRQASPVVNLKYMIFLQLNYFVNVDHLARALHTNRTGFMLAKAD